VLLTDADCVMTFEVCPVSLHHVTVLFEHPLKDTMTTGKCPPQGEIRKKD